MGKNPKILDFIGFFTILMLYFLILYDYMIKKHHHKLYSQFQTRNMKSHHITVKHKEIDMDVTENQS